MAIFKNLFRWQRGRQHSGYDKMLLCGAYWPVKFDTYLIYILSIGWIKNR